MTSAHEADHTILPELLEYLTDDEEPPQTDLDLALTDINHVVDCLFRLSVTIRNPVPHDQFMSLSGVDTTSYEPYDVNHVLENFPDIDQNLAKRLGRTVTNSRHFFKYRENHHAKLSESIDNEEDPVKDTYQTTVGSSIPAHLKDTIEEDLIVMDLVSLTIASATSYASTQDGSEALRVPLMPKEHLGAFLCLFCYLMIETKSRREWK
ncbi:hypothetical protein F5Y09DRAFT_322466 [Xylaria sp. FL1042]|nr:hypothetical protein F5Y09DRAFT_322466 [Xylaria sp. FL1042]